MKHERPDYFVEAPSVEDAVLRRIKGNFRRKMVLKGLQTGDLASIPELWRAHDISENLKYVLTSTNGPQGRGHRISQTRLQPPRSETKVEDRKCTVNL